MAPEKITNLLLRIGVAFSFLYPSIDAIFNPYSWIGYFPSFMHGILPDIVLLYSFGFFEVIVAVWILSGKKIFIPASVATVMLTAIIFFNINNFDVLFRDVSIALMSLALALEARVKKEMI